MEIPTGNADTYHTFDFSDEGGAISAVSLAQGLGSGVSRYGISFGYSTTGSTVKVCISSNRTSSATVNVSCTAFMLS